MRFKPIAFDMDIQTSGVILKMSIPYNLAEKIKKLVDKVASGAEVELDAGKRKRSLDANAYLWVLCDKIAQVIHSTKEDVYRTAVKQVGVYEQLSFTDANALKRFKENWQANGLGWIVEVVDDELMIINAYYGSSRYHTDEMSVLIEHVIDAAKELDIEVKQQEEIDSLLREWEHG